MTHGVVAFPTRQAVGLVGEAPTCRGPFDHTAPAESTMLMKNGVAQVRLIVQLTGEPSLEVRL